MFNIVHIKQIAPFGQVARRTLGIRYRGFGRPRQSGNLLSFDFVRSVEEAVVNKRLHILWTNADEVTFEKMVYMYAKNSLLRHWWKEVVLIIWGRTAEMSVKSEAVKDKLRELLELGVKVSACKACADQLGVTEEMVEIGIEVILWGEPLTRILQQNEPLITV